MPKIEVDEKKFEILKQRAQQKNHGSVEQYINSVLDQIIERLELQGRSDLSQEQEEEIKSKLEGLGYET